MNLQKVGKFIAKMRKKVGMTQSELGETLGVTGKAVSKWERGINAPDITVLVELAKLLDVTVTEILIGEKIEEDISTETANELAAKSIDTYNSYSKKKYLKIIIILVTFIVIITSAFSTIYFLTNYNKCFVYKLSSASEKYHLEGLIASNQKENSILITGVRSGDVINIDNSVDSYSVELQINNLKLYKKMYSYNNQNEINIFNNINIIINNSQVISWDREKEFGNKQNIINLLITFYSNGEKINKVVIPIKTEKKFSNDRLFY